MTGKISWPDHAISYGKYSPEEVIAQRKKLEGYLELLYTDRSKINLSGIRSTEKYTFLRVQALCKTCHKSKALRNFYDKTTESITDSCSKCIDTQEMYKIIRGLI